MNPIIVTVTINAPRQKVWEILTQPEHITGWCFASPDWHAPRAENDLRVGGRFLTRMEARDGSVGFDLTGTYTEVTPLKSYAYTMDGDDQRKVVVTLRDDEGKTLVTETFDPENENPADLQRAGWQSILDECKRYAEEKLCT